MTALGVLADLVQHVPHRHVAAAEADLRGAGLQPVLQSHVPPDGRLLHLRADGGLRVHLPARHGQGTRAEREPESPPPQVGQTMLRWDRAILLRWVRVLLLS